MTLSNIKHRYSIDEVGEFDRRKAMDYQNVEQGLLSWSTFAKTICCINVYPNGVTISLHEGLRDEDFDNKGCVNSKYLLNQFHLRFRDTRDYQIPDGKYYLYRKQALEAVEKHLSLLNQRGMLNSTVIYFGSASDPFLAFHKKFDLTTGCLNLFEQYKPQKLLIQTRSPMVIAALPVLKLLGERSVVVIPIETHLERSVVRYMPGKPRIAERLVATQGLRRQGVVVDLCVSPILPYGDPKRDAWDFAELLTRHSDYISLGCLSDGSESSERHLKNIPIAQKLASDEQFLFLRPKAYSYLLNALLSIAPEKLELPIKRRTFTKVGQLELFAA